MFVVVKNLRRRDNLFEIIRFQSSSFSPPFSVQTVFIWLKKCMVDKCDVLEYQNESPGWKKCLCHPKSPTVPSVWSKFSQLNAYMLKSHSKNYLLFFLQHKVIFLFILTSFLNLLKSIMPVNSCISYLILFLRILMCKIYVSCNEMRRISTENEK